MGREFESEVSIRIPPPKSPTGSISSSTSFNYLQNLPNTIIPSSSTSSKAYKSSNKFHTTHSQTTSQLPVIGGKSTSHSTERPSRNVLGGAPLKLVPLQQDPELRSLWKDVKSKMESRVPETADHLEVTGSRIKLVSSSSAETTTTTTSTALHQQIAQHRPAGSDGHKDLETKLPVLISANEQEKLKRSLQRLKRILDDD